MSIEERLEAVKAKIAEMIADGIDMEEALAVLGVVVNE